MLAKVKDNNHKRQKNQIVRSLELILNEVINGDTKVLGRGTSRNDCSLELGCATSRNNSRCKKHYGDFFAFVLAKVKDNNHKKQKNQVVRSLELILNEVINSDIQDTKVLGRGISRNDCSLELGCATSKNGSC